MAAPFFTHLDGRIPVARHDHVAVLYRGRAVAFRLLSFLAEGLSRGDLCYYLAPGSYHVEMLQRLRALRPDLDRHLQAAKLRLDEGGGDFRTLRQRTQQVFEDAERTRAPGVRWLEDGSWPRPEEAQQNEFFEFHALLNFQVKHYPSVAICQYAVDELEPHLLFSAIAVHRHLIVHNTLVRDNPFYIPAEKFIPLSPADRARDLTNLFREVGFDLEKLLAAIKGYGRLKPGPAEEP
jgi:hypothetical protein